jgi:hypothetical protein
MKLSILDFGRVGVPKGWHHMFGSLERDTGTMAGFLIEHPKDGLMKPARHLTGKNIGPILHNKHFPFQCTPMKTD